MTEPNADWVEFSTMQELRSKRIITRWIGNQEVAVTIHDGTIRAFCSVCPHKGGPLHEGQWGPGPRVRCPWHGYVFDLSTGECESRSGLHARLFSSVERDGKVFVAFRSPHS